MNGLREITLFFPFWLLVFWLFVCLLLLSVLPPCSLPHHLLDSDPTTDKHDGILCLLACLLLLPLLGSESCKRQAKFDFLGRASSLGRMVIARLPAHNQSPSFRSGWSLLLDFFGWSILPSPVFGRPWLAWIIIIINIVITITVKKEVSFSTSSYHCCCCCLSALLDKHQFFSNRIQKPCHPGNQRMQGHF